MNNKNHIKWGLTAFLVVIGSLLGYYVIFHIERFSAVISNFLVILMPVIDGLVLAYVLTPLLNTIEKKVLKPCFAALNIKIQKKHRRMLAIVITMAMAIFVLYLFFSFVIPQIVNSIKTIIDQFPTYVDQLTLFISDVFEKYPDVENVFNNLINDSTVNLEQFFNKTIIPKVNSLIMTISFSVYSIVKEVWNLIIGFIISIYLLAGKDLFAAQAKKITYAFCSIEASNRFIRNMRFANKTFVGFLVGKILDSLIIGVLCFVCTSIIGTPFCVLISVIIGVTNIIPFFGPFLGAIPSIILILLVDPLQALYFLIFVFILQQVDGNIIGPKILGSSTGLSSFWVIFAITLFGGMWGILGMIVGVPILAVIFAFVKSLVESKLENKQLPVSTANYFRLLYINPESNEKVDFAEDAKKPFESINTIEVKHEKKCENKKNNDKNSSQSTNLNITNSNSADKNIDNNKK